MLRLAIIYHAENQLGWRYWRGGSRWRLRRMPSVRRALQYRRNDNEIFSIGCLYEATIIRQAEK